jgi:hypothetical protein
LGRKAPERCGRLLPICYQRLRSLNGADTAFQACGTIRGPIVTLDDRDREVLEFLAAHRLALADYLTVLLGNRDRARRHLGGLLASELVQRERVMRSEPACFQITRAGLAVIGSQLPSPEFDPRYRRDVGVAWMWLAARAEHAGRSSGS